MNEIRRLIAVALLAGLVLGGCTNSGSRHPHATASASPSTAAPATAWSRKDLHPVTQPAAIGDRFVFYTAASGGLRFMALDARTGATAWSDSGSSSRNAPGQPPAFIATPTAAIYLRSAGQDYARLVTADARDGTVLWKTDTGTFSSWPAICPDDPTAVCITGSSTNDPASADTTSLRYDVATGAIRSSVTISSDPGGREVGPDLFDPGTRKPELLTAVHQSSIAWSKPLRSIFTLPGASTDYGWNFARLDRGGIFIGSPGWPPIKQTSSLFQSDLSHGMAAAFRVRDGSVAWRISGALFICNFLPCGSINSSFTTPSDVAGETATTGLALRMIGTITGTPSERFTLSKNARAWIEGFDLRTGKIRWTFSAGRNEGLLSQTALPPLAGPETIAIASADGRLTMLDLTSGKTRALDRSTTFWCRRIVTYKSTPYPTEGGQQIDSYIGEYALFPCDGAGSARAIPSAAPSFIAKDATADGLAAWSEANGVFTAPAA